MAASDRSHGSREASAATPPRLPLAMLYPVFFAAVYLSHITLLRLPYFWDEGGYYIPAALDFFRTGTLIPYSTLTNAHPPVPSILLAGWWHLSGFVPSGTRTLVVMVAAAALLAVYRLAAGLRGWAAGCAVALLTAAYPIWFAQSTLAHADIFAAAFTLWGLAFFLLRDGPETSEPARGSPGDRAARPAASRPRHGSRAAAASLLFSLAALSKETAIVTPVALAALEAVRLVRQRADRRQRELHLRWIAALLLPMLPLLGWYLYHWHRTGFFFGNPEFLRYNATANLAPYRIALSLWHRLLHLTAHMNLWVPTSLTVLVALLLPRRPGPAGRPLPRAVLTGIAVVLLANWAEFSVLGGALLTRYLLPMYPLVLLLCVTVWQQRLRLWPVLAAGSLAAFVIGIFYNPPYAFAPEDNLTYRDMIVLHRSAVRLIDRRYPGATVLTAWPASAELERPELGYTDHPVRTVILQNFSASEIARASAEAGSYNTALLFSTKWAPPPGATDLGRGHRAEDARYFDFHHDLLPSEVASDLHGTVVWQQRRQEEWAAVLRFPGAAPGTVPGAALGTVPGPALGTAPGAALGTVPGPALGTAPGAALGTVPGPALGTAPGAAPGPALGR